MQLRFCFRVAASLALLLFARQATAAPFHEVQLLLKKYCVECHSAEKKEGELDLQQFDSQEKAVAAGPRWEGIMGRFFAREMPPEGSPQPNDPERDKLREWMNSLIPKDENCDKLASDRTQNFYKGHVMSRRLTRTEYANCVRDLLGVAMPVADRLPSDGSGGEGFDTVGDSLYLSPIHLEKYLEAAELVTAALLPDAPAENEPADVVAARAKLLAVSPSAELSPRDAAKQTLSPLVRRAFRRPVSDEELQRYLALFDRATSRGDAYPQALRLSLQAILLSPNFLILAEPEPAESGVYPLADHPLAARLAIFLWSSLPDDELLAAADAGQLQTDDGLRTQVRRMLRDPRAKALGDNFGMQWLGLTSLGVTVRPDSAKFPQFDDRLAADMRGETAMFVASIFQDDRSVLELLDADFTFANARLAELYGLPAVEGESLQRVSLTDRNRGGVLTQASVLTVSSYPLRTSPVLRGRWLLEELLGGKVPPPPPNVPALVVDNEGNSTGLTIRQQLEQHRADANCASCHARMDPLGFGLENFDPIGRWRTEVAGQPIDAGGKLPSGEEYTGPAELKQLLLKRKGEFVKHLTRKMVGYAYGRELNRFDDCVLRDAVAALEQNDYRSSVLVEQIVLSYPFRHRYCKK